MRAKYVTQVYEIASPSEAEALIGLGVDIIGSVLLSKEEWKRPEIKETIKVVQGAGRKSTLIPLFNDEDAVFRTVEYHLPDILHFCETLAGFAEKDLDRLFLLQEKVRERFTGIKITRSIPIAMRGLSHTVPTLDLASRFEPVSDHFLTDTFIDPCEFVGITGKTCDWEMASRLVRDSKIPVILAGGLSPENVFDSIMATRPFGVDTCTLTNRLDDDGKPIRFKKDLDKVESFIKEVRRAEERS